jgi:hypothetical protein
MISSAQYTAKIVIKFFNCANQAVFLNKVKLKNGSEASKHSINGLGIKNFFVVAFITNTIPNPKSLSS